MEPSTDAQTLSPVLALPTHDNFLNGMETLPWLDLKENELIPAWWDAFHGHALRLRLPLIVGFDRIEFKSASPLLLPHLVVGKRKV